MRYDYPRRAYSVECEGYIPPLRHIPRPSSEIPRLRYRGRSGCPRVVFLFQKWFQMAHFIRIT